MASNPAPETVPQAARSAVWVENNVLAVREVLVQPPGAGEVLVRIRACGICGSDLHAFHSERPRQHFPGGGPGHELAGEVTQLGPGVEGLEPGARVAVFPGRVCDSCEFCRSGRPQLCPALRIAGANYPGGMCEYFLAQAGYVYRVPDGMPWTVAALSEPCAISLHGLKRAGLARGQRVLVLGAGTIGLFAALIAHDAGAGRIGITARYPQQAAAARTLGVTDVFDPSDVELGKPASLEHWDLVVESVGGSAPTLQQAVNVVARGGTILLLGVHTESMLIRTTRIFFHELTIVGAFGYDHAGARSDYDEALALLHKYQAIVEPLITHRFPLEQASEAFAAAVDKRSGAIKVTVLP